MNDAYWHPSWHDAYFDAINGRTKLLEHGDLWIMQFAFSLFTLFFSTYEIAVYSDSTVLGALAFNLALVCVPPLQAYHRVAGTNFDTKLTVLHPCSGNFARHIETCTK